MRGAPGQRITRRDGAPGALARLLPRSSPAAHRRSRGVRHAPIAARALVPEMPPRRKHHRHARGVARLALGDDLHLLAHLDVLVAILDEQAAADAARVVFGDRLDPPLLVLEDADVRLSREDLERVLIVAGREHELDEDLAELLGELAVDRSVEAVVA